MQSWPLLACGSREKIGDERTQVLRVVTREGQEVLRLQAQHSELAAILAVPNTAGTRVCTVATDGTAAVWDLQRRCCLCVFEPATLVSSRLRAQRQLVASLSPCGRYLIAGAASAYLIDVRTCTRVRHVPVSRDCAFVRYSDNGGSTSSPVTEATACPYAVDDQSSSSSNGAGTDWCVLAPSGTGVVWMPLLPPGGFSAGEAKRVLSSSSMSFDRMCFACNDEVLVGNSQGRISAVCIATCK